MLCNRRCRSFLHSFRLAAALLWILAANVSPLRADEPAAKSTYAEDAKFLAGHTEVIELTDGRAARVAICPAYQARVMLSTCEGEQGPSFGWLNREFIAAGKPDLVFNNYGGEDRFWLAPEAGQFALFFRPGAEQKVANWLTLPGLNEGAFRVVAREGKHAVRMSHRLQLTNASNTRFDLEVARNVRLLQAADIGKLLGPEVASALQGSAVKLVGFASENTITNRGQAMSRETGLVSIWTLGQFRPGPKTVIIVPYRAGDEAELGPVVTPDYFGPVPAERLQVTPEAVLFLGDGHFRAKLGVSPRRSRGLGGSFDFESGVLTVVSYSLPADAAKQLYVNNAWELPQQEPYHGDTFNSYNDGAAEPGAKTLGGFYELETVSPTRTLAPGQSLSHTHRTLHFTGDKAAVARLAKLILGVDLDAVRKTMLP